VVARRGELPTTSLFLSCAPQCFDTFSGGLGMPASGVVAGTSYLFAGSRYTSTLGAMRELPLRGRILHRGVEGG
jgi:hypothetical protein